MSTEAATTSRYRGQVQGDVEMRLVVHEMRKVSDDVAVAVKGDSRRGESEGASRALQRANEAAYRRYERVAERLNERVHGEVQAWFEEVRDQEALVLALATSGVDVGDGWSAEDVKEFRATGAYGGRKMVEVLEVVLMELDGTIAYRQRVQPEFVPGGELMGEQYHGLTLEALRGEPSFGAIAGDFRRAVEGRRVIAYNAVWAAKVLAAESARWGVPDPVASPGLGEDDCVMLHRSRYAAYFRPSDYEYRTLRLGSPDTTPMGVAGAVCDVVATYAKGDAPYFDRPYDPEDGRGQKERDHDFGWRDVEKAAHDRREAEREAERKEEHERGMAERRANRRRRREEEMRAEGKSEEEIAATSVEGEDFQESDFEDIAF